MTGDEDETQTSATATLVDPPDPALAPTVADGSGDGTAPRGQIVIRTTLEGLPQPGERVGRYELGPVIGRGGMGVVFKARDPDLDRALAIKVVLPATSSKRSQQRLLDEARAMAKLHHPAVVPVFDVGTTDRGVYVVMPFLANGTLGEWASAARRPWREVLARYIAAGRGLAAAHAAGLVHRDFKPRNVMIGEKGQLMVGDFGLAEDARTTHAPPSTASQVSSLEGTPAYMAPEQASGQPVDARADQFSFCISLWEGLHGERPTDAATRQGILLGGAVPAIPADRRGAPGWLLSAIARGWQAEPDRRWPSMTALLDHIERRLRRPRRIALGAAALGVLGVAAAIVLVAPARREDPCPDPRARMAIAWSPEIRAQIEAAFNATGLPYAPDALARILPALDRYASDWRAKHIEVCRAANVAKTQTSTLLDQRMACLDRRLTAFDVRTEALAKASPKTVESSVEQIDQLPAISDCDDAERLLAFPLPTAAVERERIIDLERQLDDLTVQLEQGQLKESLARATELVPIVQKLGYPPLELRTWSFLGENQGGPAQEAALRALIDAAARGNDDRRAAEAWIQLFRYLWFRVQRKEEAVAIMPAMEAAVVRAGSPPALVSRVKGILAVRAASLGNPDEAIRLGEEAAALAPDSVRRAAATHDLATALTALGRYEVAMAPAARAVEQAIEAYGERHPIVATYLYRQAQIALQSGRQDQASELLTRATSIQRAALPKGHPALARTLVTTANLARARGDHALVRTTIAEAIETFELVGDRMGLAGATLTLAEAVRATEGLTAARPHYDRAIALLAESAGKDHASYAMAEANLAGALADDGQCATAIPLFDHAISVLQKANDARLPMMLGASADCDLQAPARIGTAISKYESAVSACQKTGCPPDLALGFQFGLGAALHSKRDGRRGLALIREARAEALAQGLQPLVDKIDAWTKKHKARL